MPEKRSGRSSTGLGLPAEPMKAAPHLQSLHSLLFIGKLELYGGTSEKRGAAATVCPSRGSGDKAKRE